MMKYNIKLSRAKNSKLSSIDFDNIPFGRTFSDHMFTADFIDGQWTNLQIIPFGHFQIHPANLALHYGQSIFEGMKAFKDQNGKPVLFRPELNAQRFNTSAQRMCMPDVPEGLFLQAIHQLVDLEKNWIPDAKGSSLYIRPLMFANAEFIGVQASNTYKLIIFTGPVSSYYPKPVRLYVEQKYVRAVGGGVGEAKTAGNYAASLLPAKKAKQAGYDQILWMDAHEFKYIQEVGTMNIFFVIDGKIITPATDGAILKGITRKSIVTILKDEGYELEERKLSIDEVVEAYQLGKLDEVFGAGTAAVVSHVADITYGDLVMDLPPVEKRKIGPYVKSVIQNLQTGKLKDKYNWIVPVEERMYVGQEQ